MTLHNLPSSMESQPLLQTAARSSRRKKYVAYTLNIICSLLCASFTCFSLYTAQFVSQLGYTPIQINTISIIGEIGLYSVVPLYGYLADISRLSFLGALGGVFFACGYLGAYFTFVGHGSYLWMSFSFCLIAMATSASYICCVVNCARLYPKSAFLAIALPTTAYGGSTLFFSQIFDRCSFFHVQQDTEDLNVPLIYAVMSVLTFFVGVTAAVCPILGDTDRVASKKHHVEESTPNIHGDLAEDQYDTEVMHVSHFERFTKDHQTWPLLLTFVLATGPLENYLNNMGLIVQSAHPEPSTSGQISLYSTFSTLSRLAVGAYLDFCGHSVRPSKVLIFMLLMLSVAQLGLSNLPLTPSLLSFWTSLSGTAYGSFFTLYPVVVTRVWGIDGFATFWGMFIGGPAIGTLVYGGFFGLWYQYTKTWSLVYNVSAVALVFCSIIVYRLQSRWVE